VPPRLFSLFFLLFRGSSEKNSEVDWMKKFGMVAAIAVLLLASIALVGAVGTGAGKSSANNPKPDLKMTLLSFSWQPGGIWNLLYTTSNVGSAAAGSSHTRLSFNNGQAYYDYIPPLAPGTGTTTGWYYAGINPCPPGVTRGSVTAYADAYNEVQESNENNNAMTTNYDCPPPAAA